MENPTILLRVDPSPKNVVALTAPVEEFNVIPEPIFTSL